MNNYIRVYLERDRIKKISIVMFEMTKDTNKQQTRIQKHPSTFVVNATLTNQLLNQLCPTEDMNTNI